MVSGSPDLNSSFTYANVAKLIFVGCCEVRKAPNLMLDALFFMIICIVKEQKMLQDACSNKDAFLLINTCVGSWFM